MLYDYKSEVLVQDVVLEDIELLVDDITEEFYSLRRYNELDIYTPSPIAREIISALLDEVDELWVHADSHNDLLYKNDNDVLITIANDGMIFVEEARIKGTLKSCEDSSLVYVYDGFGKKDIDTLEESAESILVFGFEEDDMDDECTFGKCECSCKENEKKSVSDVTESSYIVNGSEVSKKEYEKAVQEFGKKYLQSIQEMLNDYNDFYDEMYRFAKLFH